MNKLSFRGVNITNGLFQAAFPLVRIAVAGLPITDVCTLVVPKLRNAAFLLEI